MLTKPHNGWSDFQLNGTSLYELSYIDDIAFEWVEQAIHGLETMLPFCVKGFMEPGRFLCVVSYWNCHIICEDDERNQLDKEDIDIEYSHTSMLDFCKYLYNDIKEYKEDVEDDKNDKNDEEDDGLGTGAIVAIIVSSVLAYMILYLV